MNDSSEGWLEKFMSRNGLSLLRRTAQVQKTPEQRIDKVMSYFIWPPIQTKQNYDLNCIIAMDETAV